MHALQTVAIIVTPLVIGMNRCNESQDYQSHYPTPSQHLHCYVNTLQGATEEWH